MTYGAGAFNLVNSVASAYAEKSPLIVISGGPGRADAGSGLLVHHQAKHLKSQLEIYREMTCDQVILNDPEQAPSQIARVLDRCAQLSRPVYIEVPRDCVFNECGRVPNASPAPKADAAALHHCAREILDQVQRAKRPVLVVGIEVRRFARWT